MSTTGSDRRWSLRRRVTRWILAVTILFVVLICVLLLALVQVKRSGDDVISRWDPAYQNSQAALAALVNQETGIRGYALNGDQAALQPYRASIKTERDAVADLNRLVGGDDDLAALVARFESVADSWHSEVVAPLIARVGAGNTAAKDSVGSATSRAAFDRIRAASADLTDALGAKRDQAQQHRVRAFYLVWAVAALWALVLVAAGGVLWRGLRRAVLEPIEGLAGQTRSVAGGDLDRRIVQSGPSEIVDLGGDVDLMRETLASQILRIERARAGLQQRSAELARSNSDLEQFAYVASHDLSEPLRKVTNFCQLLERQYADQLDDKARQYIGFVVDGAKRMQILINDLLAFSRVGRTTENFVAVDLDHALDVALNSLETAIHGAGARIERGPLPSVPGDPTLLVALFQNLLGNAIKYRSPDRSPLVHVGAQLDGDVWLLTVQDNGIGIETQYAERIFTIFQRLHLRDEYGGTGIGLSLCRKIVDFHGGRIWLVENAGSGATFSFTLPSTQALTESVDDYEPTSRAQP